MFATLICLKHTMIGMYVNLLSWSLTIQPSKDLSVVEGDMNADEDGLVVRNTPQQCSKLDHSVILSNLTSQLSSLPDGQRHDVAALITSFPVLFSDVPS